MFPGIIFGFVMGFNPVHTFESEKSAKKVPDVKRDGMENQPGQMSEK
jgi:hypothetical protein